MGKPTTDRRSDDRRDAEDGSGDPLPFASFPRGEQVAHNGDGDGQECCSAEALEGAERNQLDHRLRSPRQGRTYEKDD